MNVVLYNNIGAFVKNLKYSFTNSFKLAGTLLCVSLLVFLFVSGCALNDDDGDGGVTAGTQPSHTVQGTVLNLLTRAPLAGIVCTLSPDGASTDAPSLAVSTQSTISGANGAYIFYGVPAGDYKLKTSADGFVPMTTHFKVDSNVQTTLQQLSASEWTQLLGAGHSYDPARAYVMIHSDAVSNSDDSGVTVNLTNNALTSETTLIYEAKGQISNTGAIDWTSTSTHLSGLTFFHGLISGAIHTATAVKDGYTFESVNDIPAVAGEITHVILKGTPAIDGFPVTIINNSSVYKTEEIYLAIIGQDKSGNHYYFDNGDGYKKMRIVTDNQAGDKFCFPIGGIKALGPNKFQYIHPFENTVSCRVYVFFKNRGHFKVNNGDAKAGLAEPSHMNEDKYTIFDKFELTCDGSLVYLNTTVVDFIGIGFTLKFDNDGIEKGFQVACNDELAAPFLSRTDSWKNAVIKDAKGNIMRVLSPNQIENSFGSLDEAINAGWSHYSTNELEIKYNWTYKGRVHTAEGELKNHFVFNVTAGAGNVGDTYDVSFKPSSFTVFKCDGDPLSNDGSKTTVAQRNLHACICAALNRGVFCNKDWGASKDYYADSALNAKQYNLYSKMLHDKAMNGLVYGFPYDDHYGKDPTFKKTYKEAKTGVTVSIPKMPALIK